MRVAVVSLETVDHRDTETNRRLRTILELVRDAGHEVHVFCAQFWDGEHRTFDRDDVTYHGLAPDTEAWHSFVARLPIAIASLGPDIVHASERPPSQLLAASWGATLARVPFLLEWYGDDVPESDGWTDWTTRRADRLVVPSELVATWARERGVDGDGIEVVPNPIDIDRIRSTEPDEEVDVIYARRLDDGANLESLLLGLAELRDRDWSATVIGDGPRREEYERLASDLRIDDRITFAGECSLEERIAAYRGAHVFAQTAEHCVFPTEMLRALAAGCVGIIEYHVDSSAHELVEGWDRGFRTTSEEELADAILEAGDLERLTFDDRFADYDRDDVRDQYLTTYRALQESSGLL
ncbi:glycosyltransferase [Halobiforma nitratireducens]|uniref:Group 1 glycosyl transferase n=1 Tax=Halobiforma nitratireducens JCM 10879 TaxID=1227454 RepID=M0M9C0_9EURY|nr:glycosyltransferase [Halobiforma nitratireducens]EMA41933.1 group 1 glycosyl transferase [Halobiforma nitratireducens JCM 10879]